MTTIGTAYVQVLPSVEGIQNNLKSALSGPAASAGNSAGAESGQSFIGSMAGKITLGAAAVVGAATAVVAGAVKAASQIADLGDEIDKNSQKLGISAKSYQEWDAVLQHSGTSMSAQTATFRTLTKATQNSSAEQVAAFEKLGLSMEQVAGMNTEDLFASVISGLQGMEEGSERTATATSLLGRGATELGPLLNTSAEDTQAMIDRVNELGGVMSDSAVKSGAAYKDSLQDLQTAMEGLKNNVLIGLLPAITFVMDKLTGWVTQIRESTVIQNIKDKIDGLKDNLSGMGDKFDAVWGFVSTTVEGAGGVIVAAINLVLDAVSWLVEQINTDGTFINQAWGVITTIFETASGIISGLLGTLTSILQGDWSGALENIQNVALTIWTSVKSLFGQFVQNIISKVRELPANMLRIGGDIVSGIWRGISNGFTWIKEKISGWVGDLVGFFKGLLGISSPSKVFASIGDYMVQGLGQGWDRSFGQVKSGIEDDLNFSGSVNMGQDFRSFDLSPRAIDLAPQAGTVTNTITTNVYAAPGQSAEEIAQKVERRIAQNILSREAVWA